MGADCHGCGRSWGAIEAGHGHRPGCAVMGPPTGAPCHADPLEPEVRADRRDIHVGQLGPDVFANQSVLASAHAGVLAAAARVLIAVAKQRQEGEDE